MAGKDSNTGAKRARQAREALGLDPVAPLACLLTVVEERAALPVVVTTMPEDVAGACVRHGDAAVLWVNGTQFRPRQRFTLAHELGHAWCGHDGTLEVDTVETLSGRTSNPLEIQANAFAGEFLVPKAGVQEALAGRRPTLEEVVVLGAHYGVSALVVLIRLIGAGLVDDERAARLRKEIEAGEHAALWEQLGMEPIEDRLGALDRLPYLSPQLAETALGTALRGDGAAAAAAAGVPAGRLGTALDALG